MTRSITDGSITVVSNTFNSNAVLRLPLYCGFSLLFHDNLMA